MLKISFICSTVKLERPIADNIPYEELGEIEIESERKALTNALKKHTNNNSVERATATADRIIDLFGTEKGRDR